MADRPEPLGAGRFEFEEYLGGGGFGVVWRARDRLMARSVAIKLLHEDLVRHPDWRARRNDAIAGRLRSRHIVQVHDLIEEGDRCAIVMEWIPGPSLAQRIRAAGKLSVEDTTRVAEAMAAALSEAHRQGIVHRDIKPANVLLGARPGDDIKVVDWGLAIGVPEWGGTTPIDPGSPTATWGATAEGPFRFAGTPAYMSPERLHGRLDRGADIWAFGAVLFECLAGEPAFPHRGPDLLEAIAAGLIDWARLPESVPDAMRRLIASCLEVEPRKRLRDMALARAFLEGDGRLTSLRGLPGPGSPPPPAPAVEVRRDTVVAAVEAALGQSAFVGLSGPAGCGKSWIAATVARRRAAQGRASSASGPRVLWMDLRDLSGCEEWSSRLAVQLGLPASADDGAIRHELAKCSEGGFLVVLDNADRGLPGLPDRVERLATEGMSVVLTARRSPSHGSWLVVPVEPLTCPPESAIENEREMSGYEAVRLFVGLASSAWRGFRLDASNASSVASLCRRLGGLPRAIELAAARVRLIPPQDLLRQIDQIVKPFVEGDAAHTVAQTVEWSVSAATPEERLLLERLSVFEGGWTVASVEAVCCDESLPRAVAHELLNSLIDQALVQPEAASIRPRYRLLHLVRDLCRRHLEAAGREEERETLRRRHLNRFRDLVAAGASIGAERVDLELERSDCCAAIRFGLGRPDLLQAAIDVAIEMQEDWYDHGRYAEGLELIEALIAAWEGQGGVREVRLVAARSKLQWLRDPRSAYAGYRHALALQRAIVATAESSDAPAERLRLAAVLHNVGLCAQQVFEYEASRQALDESLRIHRSVGAAPEAFAASELSLAILDYLEGNLDAAAATLAGCESVFHQAGDLIRLSTNLQYRGRIALDRGDPAGAAQFTREALAIRRRDQQVEGVADSLRCAGEIAMAKGDACAATKLFAAAERRRRALGLEVPATDAARYDRALQAARGVTSFGEFDAWWAEGASLSDEQAESLVVCGEA